MWLLILVLLVMQSLWCAEALAQVPGNGERLFIQKGCLGCHGVSGRGGAGPDLAGTALPFEQFQKQLRTTPKSQK